PPAGRAAAPGLGVHRPVLGAAVRKRLAQPLRVHAERLSEPKTFVVRRHAGPEDEVVYHLADLSRPRRTQMEDVRGKRAERGPARFEGRIIARPVDEKLPGHRGGFAARK